MSDPEDQLGAIEAARQQLGPQQERGRRQLAGLCIGLGALLGAMHLVVVVFPPQRSLPAFLIACAVIVLAILALTFGYLRVRRLMPAGGGQRYLIALMISMVLYAASILIVVRIAEPVPIAVLVAVVIAAPLTFAGIRELRR